MTPSDLAKFEGMKMRITLAESAGYQGLFEAAINNGFNPPCIENLEFIPGVVYPIELAPKGSHILVQRDDTGYWRERENYDPAEYTGVARWSPLPGEYIEAQP